jgi:hypothetical protein
MHITDLTGLAGLAFAALALLLRWPRLVGLTDLHRITLAAVVLLALLMPINGLSVAEWLRGMVGDLSITTLLLLALTSRKNSAPIATATLLLIATLGSILYVTALGFSSIDAYRFGFGSLPLLAGLLTLAIVSGWQKNWALALAISLAVLAWSVGYYESTNVWDYLLDPLLFIYALSVILRRFLHSKKITEEK